MTLPKTFTAGELLTATDLNGGLKHVEGAHGSGTTGGSTAETTVTHGLGYTPSTVLLQVVRPGAGSDDVARLANVVVWAVTATTLTVRSYRRDTQALFTDNTVAFHWMVR